MRASGRWWRRRSCGWLHGVDGPVDQFNQTMVVQAPAGVDEADVAVVLQALLDRHATLRLYVDDVADDWSLTVPEAGSVNAARLPARRDIATRCCPTRRWRRRVSRLDPAAGAMLSALWVASTSQLVVMVHHLAVDGVSWRILLEDLEHRVGAASRTGNRWRCLRGGRRSGGGRRCSTSTRTVPTVAEQAGDLEAGRRDPRLRSLRATCDVDTFAGAGHLAVSTGLRDDAACCFRAVPTAFHAGIQDILLIAFALGGAPSSWAPATAPIAIDVEGHGRHEELDADVDLSRTVGWFTTKYPVSLTVGGLPWGMWWPATAAGCGDQGRQGAAARPAGRADLRVAALPEPRCRPGRRRPADRLQLPGPPGRGSAELSERTVADRPRTGWPSPRTSGGTHAADAHGGTQRRHHRHRRPVRSCRPTGRGRPRRSTTTRSTELSRLWFEALTGICAPRAHRWRRAHSVRHRSCPPGPAADRRTCAARYRIADILPLTPVQQGLLFHANTRARERRRPVRGATGHHASPAGSIRDRLRDACAHACVTRHPNLAARFLPAVRRAGADHPRRTPSSLGGTSNSSGDRPRRADRQQLCAAERAAVSDLADQPAFRAAPLRIAE